MYPNQAKERLVRVDQRVKEDLRKGLLSQLSVTVRGLVCATLFETCGALALLATLFA